MLKTWLLIEKIKDSLVQDEEGISAVEYGVLGAFVIVALVTALGLLTPAIGTAFGKITSALGGAAA